jgi:gliding motility-associated-like protein
VFTILTNKLTMKVFVDLYATYRIFKSSSFLLLGGFFIFSPIGYLFNNKSNDYHSLENSLTAVIEIINLPVCGEADGVVLVTISGGSGSYSVGWSDGGNGATRNDLAAGTYSFTAIDLGGSACIITQTFTLANEVIGGATINITNEPIMVSCAGEADGVVNFTINFLSGFVLPETVGIVDAAGNPSNNGFLAAGTYFLIVTDGNGCLGGQNGFEVTEPSLMEVEVTLGNADCDTLGMISLEVTGGNGGYVYDWEDLGGSNNPADRNNLVPGFYNLTVTDLKGCTAIVNNLFVADDCDPCPNLIIDEIVSLTVFECYELGFYCLPIEPPALFNYQITDNGAPYFQGVAPCDFDSIQIPHGTQIAADTGYHQIIVHNIFTGCRDTLIIEVACTNIPCPEIYTGSENLIAADCDSLTALCLNIPLVNLFDYTVLDNGTVHQGGYNGCDIDSTINYLTIGFNTQGDYALDSWTINGQVFSIDSFTNTQELVDSMNIWDPNANWEVQGLLIVGGDSPNVYGNLVISTNGAVIANVNPELQLIPNGVAIRIDTGFHEIIVMDTITGCVELTEIFISCSSMDTIELTLLIGFSDTICMDTAGFSGIINTFNNLCFQDNLDFFLNEDQYCVEFTGINMGIDTLCIQICDDLGFCHETYIIVDVLAQNIDTISMDILAGTTDTICLDTTELAGNIVSIANYCIGESGTFVDFDILDDFCVSVEGLLPDGTESACIEICDEFGYCDTTIFILTSVGNTGIDPPVAVDDDTTTLTNRPVYIDILGNDTLSSTLIDIGILTEPENGAVVINTDLTIIYIPEAGLCPYIDNFTYFITTLGGSDTATVMIAVSCDELVIYNGISPNGDGVNDGFVIEGIDNFPVNEVRIFNRWGNQVFLRKGYTNDDPFDGNWNGVTLPDGTYYYLIEIEGDDGETLNFDGYLQIHR